VVKDVSEERGTENNIT